MSQLTHVHDDMTTMTTPTTKGWRSDVTLPGWSVTLVGPGEYHGTPAPSKDGRPWVALGDGESRQAPQEHDRNTTGTRSTPKLSHQFLKMTNLGDQTRGSQYVPR